MQLHPGSYRYSQRSSVSVKCFVAAKSFSFSASYSSWIFVIIVCPRGALMLESPVATRKTLVNPSSSTILVALQLFAIHLATVLVNLSQADLVRGLRCSVRVVSRIPLELPTPTNACFPSRRSPGSIGIIHAACVDS